VLELLPVQLRERDVQPIGRLDEDTTGLLLITDDGQLNHQLSSAKRKVPKVYLATTKHPLDQARSTSCWPACCSTTSPSRLPLRPRDRRRKSAAPDADRAANTIRSSAWWRPSATGSRRCTVKAVGELNCRMTSSRASGAGCLRST
jgi:23S rRNA-/tRNA-specific pseudouridylate synthase